MKPWRRFGHQDLLLGAIWATLGIAFLGALVTQNWSLAFVSGATAVASLMPRILARQLEIRLPLGFYLAIVVFIFSTIFLGEAFDFYERYWWWDVVLHGGSAMGFGVIGFLLVLALFEGDRYAAPPSALAVIAFSFAMMIGTSWEIFEFAMDQIFGLNMQKSGLRDTMWDLIVDATGGGLSAIAGFLYLKRIQLGGPAAMIDAFIRLNRRLFRKWR